MWWDSLGRGEEEERHVSVLGECNPKCQTLSHVRRLRAPHSPFSSLLRPPLQYYPLSSLSLSSTPIYFASDSSSLLYLIIYACHATPRHATVSTYVRILEWMDEWMAFWLCADYKGRNIKYNLSNQGGREKERERKEDYWSDTVLYI